MSKENIYKLLSIKISYHINKNISIHLDKHLNISIHLFYILTLIYFFSIFLELF